MVRNTSLIVCLGLATLTAGCSNVPAPPPDTRIVEIAAMIGGAAITWTDEFALRPIQSVLVSQMRDAQLRSVDVCLSDLRDNADCIAPTGT